MASEVGICNAALRKVGCTRITSLNDGTKNANFMNDRYSEVRDWLLEAHPWNFAATSAQLAQTATTPAVEFDYQYALPADYIRAISVHDSNEGTGIARFKIRNGYIESTASQLWMVYVSRVTDPNTMSPEFRELLAEALAVEAANGIVKSNTMFELRQKSFEKQMRRARSADAQADLPDRMPVGTWLTSRTGRLMERRWTW